MYDLDPSTSTIYIFLFKPVSVGLWACFAKCCLRTWDLQHVGALVRNAEPRAPPQMDGVRIHIVTGAQLILMHVVKN